MIKFSTIGIQEFLRLNQHEFLPFQYVSVILTRESYCRHSLDDQGVPIFLCILRLN